MHLQMSKVAKIEVIVYFSIEFSSGQLTVSASHYYRGKGKSEILVYNCRVLSECYHQAQH